MNNGSYDEADSYRRDSPRRYDYEPREDHQSWKGKIS